ncbi:DMT family transporter [Aestuariivirga sp.]|uniref:DMT family transporter n=1 Tax=Aestuariivirga sp. TaxID=2650926 RepID=UPI0039E599E5
MNRTLHLPHWLPAAAVAACGAMWGLFWFPLRWIESLGVGGGWASVFLNIAAMAAAAPWLLRREAWRGFKMQSITGLMLGTAFALYTVSLVLTDVLHAILLFYMTPVWSTLATWAFFGHRLSWSRIAALVLGFAGLALILGLGASLPLPHNAGDWIALVSGMIWSAGTIRASRLPATGVALTFFSFAAGSFIASVVILIIGMALSAPFAAMQQLLPALPWIILVALTVYVPPTAMVLWATQRIDPGRAGILLMTEVVVGSISAGLLSGETFGLREIAGTLLIIGAGLVEVTAKE